MACPVTSINKRVLTRLNWEARAVWSVKDRSNDHNLLMSESFFWFTQKNRTEVTSGERKKKHITETTPQQEFAWSPFRASPKP